MFKTEQVLTYCTRFSETKFKLVLFCIGLFLVIWRSHDCLQKYLYKNLSTKINMVKSYDTILPALVICPEYFEAYDLR